MIFKLKKLLKGKEDKADGAFLVVCHIDFNVIPGKILRSGNKIPIIKPRISLNRRSLNWGSVPYTLL